MSSGQWRSITPSCPGFNRWKYGLADMPVYADGQTPLQLETITSNVTWFICWGSRTSTRNHPALDKGCEAKAQGAYRLARGRNCFGYLMRLHPEGVNQRLVEVPGVGHNGDGMLTSPEGQKALFDQ